MFAAAQLDIEFKGPFGKPSVPREWFLVPLEAVNATVERLKDGGLTKYGYEPEIAALKLRQTTD